MTERRVALAIAAIAGLVTMASVTIAASPGGGATHASATFVDASGAELGWAKLVEDETRLVHLSVHVKGLTPGRHGIHIHAVGACAPTFAAAGGHYNPTAAEHGLQNPLGPHAGDLPNLIVNADGVGHLDATTDRVTLTNGPRTTFDTTPDAVGSALIIHANEDDQVTNATNGNSGARVACAVIVAG